MINEPLISIGMPVYNGGAYVAAAIDSILAQTYTRIELIIGDNASTDATWEICQAKAQKDHRIRLVRNEQNLGAASNYNRVFSLAEGQYFKWAAADDLISDNFICNCLQQFEQPEIALAFGQTIVIDKDGVQLEAYADEFELNGATPSQRLSQFVRRFQKKDKCNAVFGLIRSDLLHKTRLIDRFVSSDIILLAELALLGKFSPCPNAVFYRRDHEQSSMRAYSLKERSAWFDPALKQAGIPNVNWRLFKELAKSISALPVSDAEKILCQPALIEWGWQHRSQLYRETRRTFKNFYHARTKISGAS